MMNRLTTQQSTVKLKQSDTRIIKIRGFEDFDIKEYTDFVIDGSSMTDLIRNNDPDVPELSSVLQNAFYLKFKNESIQQLTNKADSNLASGRISLYVCPFDGDPACLSVGCRIEYSDKYVRWYDFAWDNFEKDNELLDDDDSGIDLVEHLESFTFDRIEYEKLFDNLSAELNNVI